LSQFQEKYVKTGKIRSNINGIVGEPALMTKESKRSKMYSEILKK